MNGRPRVSFQEADRRWWFGVRRRAHMEGLGGLRPTREARREKSMKREAGGRLEAIQVASVRHVTGLTWGCRGSCMPRTPHTHGPRSQGTGGWWMAQWNNWPHRPVAAEASPPRPLKCPPKVVHPSHRRSHYHHAQRRRGGLSFSQQTEPAAGRGGRAMVTVDWRAPRWGVPELTSRCCATAGGWGVLAEARGPDEAGLFAHACLLGQCRLRRLPLQAGQPRCFAPSGRSAPPPAGNSAPLPAWRHSGRARMPVTSPARRHRIVTHCPAAAPPASTHSSQQPAVPRVCLACAEQRRKRPCIPSLPLSPPSCLLLLLLLRRLRRASAFLPPPKRSLLALLRWRFFLLSASR